MPLTPPGVALLADDEDGQDGGEGLGNDGEVGAADPAGEHCHPDQQGQQGRHQDDGHHREGQAVGTARQNHGSAVIWFQSMKSGMPGVDCIFVASGVDASSFRNIAMQ